MKIEKYFYINVKLDNCIELLKEYSHIPDCNNIYTFPLDCCKKEINIEDGIAWNLSVDFIRLKNDFNRIIDAIESKLYLEFVQNYKIIKRKEINETKNKIILFLDLLCFNHDKYQDLISRIGKVNTILIYELEDFYKKLSLAE